MGLIRYLVLGDPPRHGLSPRRWRRFVKDQPPLVARWLRWSQTSRELTLERTIRERFDALVPVTEVPVGSRVDAHIPDGRIELEWGPLEGGAWDPVNGWVNLTEDEIRERSPEFYAMATAPLVLFVLYDVPRLVPRLERITPEEEASGPFFCTPAYPAFPHLGAKFKVVMDESWHGTMTCGAHAPWAV